MVTKQKDVGAPEKTHFQELATKAKADIIIAKGTQVVVRFLKAQKLESTEGVPIFDTFHDEQGKAFGLVFKLTLNKEIKVDVDGKAPLDSRIDGYEGSILEIKTYEAWKKELKTIPKGTQVVVEYGKLQETADKEVAANIVGFSTHTVHYEEGQPDTFSYKCLRLTLPFDVTVDSNGYVVAKIRISGFENVESVKPHGEWIKEHEAPDFSFAYAGNGLYHSIYYDHPVPLLYALGR